jgi:hypothetical protein
MAQTYQLKSIKQMQRLPCIFLIFLFTLLLFGMAHAAPKTPSKVHPDTTKIIVKKFGAKALEKFKADKDFDYSNNAVGKPSLWTLLWSWVWETITGWFEKIPFGGKIIQYLILALSVALLVYVVFKSIGIDVAKLWRGEAAKVAVPYSESLENIHDINFDADIERAVSQHNYRLAVRLLYLNCLKQLNDKNLIQWQIDKTNSAYVYELTNPDQKKIFSQLTRQFEYAWYGNFSINKQAFANIDELFQNFKKQLP